jgi:hypothetical protein
MVHPKIVERWETKAYALGSVLRGSCRGKAPIPGFASAGRGVGVHRLRGLRESGWEDTMLTGYNKHYTMGLFEG